MSDKKSWRERANKLIFAITDAEEKALAAKREHLDRCFAYCRMQGKLTMNCCNLEPTLMCATVRSQCSELEDASLRAEIEWLTRQAEVTMFRRCWEVLIREEISDAG